MKNYWLQNKTKLKCAERIGQTLHCVSKPGCHAPACWTALVPVQSASYQNECGKIPKSIEIPGKKAARWGVLIVLSCLVIWKLGKVYTNDSRYLIKSMKNPTRKLFAFFPFQDREENLFSIQCKPWPDFLWMSLFFSDGEGTGTAAASIPSNASGHPWRHKKKLFYLVYTCIFFLNFFLLK